MQCVAGTYSRNLNERLDRKGTLWEGRYRASPIDSERYCLACYRYIELNPVRAGIVASPADYRWSSYHENVGRRMLCIVEPHRCFLELGNTSRERGDSYRALLAEVLPAAAVATIRKGLSLELPIGSDGANDGVTPDRAQPAAVDPTRRRPGRPRRALSL
jgi:putative transposase